MWLVLAAEVVDEVRFTMALPFCNGLASFSGAGDRCGVGLVGGVSSSKGCHVG